MMVRLLEVRRTGRGSMAARKMFPPGEVERLLAEEYDEFKLGISFRIQAGQVIMQFSDGVERIRMSGAGARKLAAMLIEKAAELDRLANTPASDLKRVRTKQASSNKSAAK
jgi:hypothetical protein